MDAAPDSLSVCSCGDLIMGPHETDERGMPLCWRCALEREMRAAHDWPPSSGNAFRGCIVGLAFSCAFWCGVALVAALLR